MEMMARRVDWEELLGRRATGDPRAAVNEALENDAPWVAYHDLPIDSFSLCIELGDLYEELREHLPIEARELCDAFASAALWSPDGGSFPNDLGEAPSPDAYLSSLGPGRVAVLADIGRRLPWSELATASSRACRDGEEPSYEEEFVPFVRQLVELFEAAEREGRGVLIAVG